MEPFIGQIILFAGNFAPKGWAFCEGQLLPISSNQALFSLLGATYGGDGKTTFALPDLRSRVPVHAGHGPGLSNYTLGERKGQETVTLTTDQIPAHQHSLAATLQAEPDADTPTNNLLTNAKIYGTGGDANTTLKATAIGSTGGNQSHPNVQPVLGLNFIIALEGLYPSRS